MTFFQSSHVLDSTAKPSVHKKQGLCRANSRQNDRVYFHKEAHHYIQAFQCQPEHPTSLPSCLVNWQERISHLNGEGHKILEQGNVVFIIQPGHHGTHSLQGCSPHLYRAVLQASQKHLLQHWEALLQVLACKQQLQQSRQYHCCRR